MRASRVVLPLILVAAAVVTVTAQAPANRPAGPPPSATGTVMPTGQSPAASDSNVQTNLQEILEESNAPDSYHYDPQGRRDPFQSLVGGVRIQTGPKPQGVPGFLIDEIHLQGTVRTKQGFVAMINGPDNKGYLIHVGDKVFDGEVIRVTETSIVFRQEVNDPTRIERYREVVKDLVPEAQKR